MTDAHLTLAALMPVPAPEAADPIALATEITARSGTSFSAGMAILPKPRRHAMRALYAFCRVVDDIADGDFPQEEKRAALSAWRGEIDALFAGKPVSAVGRALSEPIKRYDLPKAEFIHMIDGMQTDADGPVVAPSGHALALYTRQVAGSVGTLSMRIFGAWRGEVSERFALSLADALQITNILRDVEEDARIGRIYLPIEALSAHGIPPVPETIADHPALPAIRQEFGLEARALYDQARLLATRHSRAQLRPALMMMGAYEGYLDAMEARGWRDIDGLGLSKREKLLRGLRYAWIGPGQPPQLGTGQGAAAE
jgi:squalene synthase HpnD